MIRVFKSSAIEDLLRPAELDCLVADFRKYKEQGLLPDTFGRDALYDHPHNLCSVLDEKVQHIHLQDGTSDWGVKTIQYYQTSDTHLVYCQGFTYDDRFLLITILKPNAHALAQQNNIMSAIAAQAAIFRDKH